MTQGIVASYGFPSADQGPAFNDNTLGPVDRMRSWTGFSYDQNPLPAGGIPGTLLRDDSGGLIYGAWGNTLDDWPVIVGGTSVDETATHLFILDDPTYGVLDAPEIVLG
jgi:hypothetical protein